MVMLLKTLAKWLPYFWRRISSPVATLACLKFRLVVVECFLDMQYASFDVVWFAKTFYYIAPINNELVLKIHDEGENDE